MVLSDSIDGQEPLFRPRPEMVLAALRRLIRRTLAISPEMAELHCADLLGELSLVDQRMDEIEAKVLASPAYRARQELEASAVMDRLKRENAERGQDRPLSRRRPSAS